MSAEMLEQIDDDLLQRMRHDPRTFMQIAWRHPARPTDRYDFRDANGDTKLNYLLHDQGPLNPESWGVINVLKIHRGGLKTTSVTGISSWAFQMYLNFGIQEYMTAPREKPPITGFMRNFKEKVRQTGLDQNRVKDNQFEQQFEVEQQDEYGNTFPVKSVLEADSGYDPDTLRGPHSHIGVIDEFQDIGKPAFDTYVHCIDQEIPGVDYFPVIFLIGTPKETGSFYHELWKQSDQKTWNREERRWVSQSEPESYTPSEELLEEMGLDADDEMKKREVRGWHVDCYNSPLMDPAQIAQAKKNLSTRRFKTEMEAKFYDPADSLLSEHDLREHFFDDESTFRDRRKFDESFVALATDWGGGSDKNAADTVIGVAEFTESHGENGVAVDADIHKIDFLDDSLTPQEEIKEVEEYLIQYDVDLGIVDFGHGSKKFQDLQDGNNTINPDGYPQRIKACRFSNVQNKSDLKWESNSGKRRFFTVDKTHMFEAMVDAVKSGEFNCPSANLEYDGQSTKGSKIRRQLTSPYKEFTTTPSGMKKVRIEKDDNRKDDLSDVLCFLWIAYHKLGSQQLSSSVAMNMRSP